MTESIINLGIVAHADAGKTTLTEQILYQTGAIRSAGSVDDGTASTDTLEIERRRGISVKTACASVVWKGTRLNLIDAPGHSDFLSEVERTLSVLDAAVLVVSSVEGVQPQTRMLIESFRRAKLPCFLFCNKLDRVGSDWKRAVEEAEALFGASCLPLTGAEGEGTDSCRVRALDPGSPEQAEAAVVACGDDALLEEYLEQGGAPKSLAEHLRAAVGEARLVPVLCGASKYGLGVPELLDALASLGPEAKADAPDFCARVYRVEHEGALGKAAYVRVFSGTLRSRQAVETDSGEEKVTRIRRVEGRKFQDADSVGAGEIAVLSGRSSLRAGDLLGKPVPGLREYRLAEPLMLVKAQPETPDRLPELAAALQKLCDEDPTLGMEWNREKREVWVRVSGVIQLEVLEALLEERWNVKASFGKPSVIYRETPAAAAEGFEAYLSPKPCWAVVKLWIEPLPRGSGFRYESKVSPGRLPTRYQAHIETAVPRALVQGLHGWQVTDLKVTLADGESHHVHTHPLDFFVATPMAVMDGLRRAGTKLLEPMVRGEFTAPEESLGKTVSLLVAHRARFESPQMEAGRFRLEAVLPASETVDLPAEFAAATGGNGVYGSRFSHYEECPGGVGEDRERIGPDPLDRARFILAARSALSGED